MELKKRPTNTIAVPDAEDTMDRVGNNLEEEAAEQEVIPGIPPRRAIHKQTRNSRRVPSFRWGMIALTFCLITSIGLWWFWEPKSELDMATTMTPLIEVRSSTTKPSVSTGEASSSDLLDPQPLMKLYPNQQKLL